MNFEKVPVEIFTQQVLQSKPAMQITDQWPLKIEVVQQVVIKHLLEIGIYMVNPVGQEQLIRKEILYFLKNSAVILEMIDKAKKAAAAAAQRGRNMTDQ